MIHLPTFKKVHLKVDYCKLLDIMNIFLLLLMETLYLNINKMFDCNQTLHNFNN